MKNNVKALSSSSFFLSSVTLENQFQDFDVFLDWFHAKKSKENFVVREIPFGKMDKWHFSENNISLGHESGKFFRIEGIRVRTNFGGLKEWDQPIINQPEIGILGILTKVFNGIPYFLMQAKMEPGNVNILQLSPTVQATKSNFTRVHQGKLPAYLDYFIDGAKSTVLIDQLQTEQGGRFLRKRNRNIVIRVEEEVEALPDFCWLTLGEIKRLLGMNNFVNMDARSVISTIPLIDDELVAAIKASDWERQPNMSINGTQLNTLDFDLVKSICCKKNEYRTTDQIISWYTKQKVDYELNVETVPLSRLNDWKISDNDIYHSPRYFSIIGVEVKAGTREVTSWTQPLVKDHNIGFLGFLIKKINGILHFLIQAKVEPGNMDIIELSPTVSCSNISYLQEQKEGTPKFLKYFLNNLQSKILFDAIQSEEGGRFYHLQNRNMIVEINEEEDLELPDNFIWMTLSQMMDFMKYSMFNIEARSLVSSLNFFRKKL